MSMLAGPRRKQKWTLNPRGKQWSEDSGKYGQKIMEKMGWSSGKGLGAQEQGMVEHIRVKVKNDQVGIGFDKNRDDHWTEHQDSFNDLLKNLQKEQADGAEEVVEDKDKVLSGKSLEEKSKQSQKRVHYKKFTRGKDVNKYSMKDLANIFGKKDLDEKITKKEVDGEEEIVYDPVGAQDTTAGILTIKGGNINDYFKKKFKMSEKSQPLEQEESSDLEITKRSGFGYEEKSRSKFYISDMMTTSNNQSSDTESEKRRGFGFQKDGKSTFYVSNEMCTNEDTSSHQTDRSSDTGLSKKNPKKSKKRKSDDLSHVFDNPCLDLNILDSPQPRKTQKEAEQNQITPKKRTNEFIYENEGLDIECLDDEPVAKKRKSDSSFVEPHLNTSTKLTPKKLKETKKQSLANNESFLPELEVVRKSTPKKSKKKKKSDPIGLENPCLELDPFECITPYEVRRESNHEVQRSVYENPGLELEDSDKISSETMKKKCSPESSNNAYVNSAMVPESLDQVNSEDVAGKSTLASVDNVYENPAFNLDNTDTPRCKKPKRERKSKAAMKDNANLEIDNEDMGRLSLKDESLTECEIVYHKKENSVRLQESTDRLTPKKNKKGKTPSHGLENPALDLDILEDDTKISMDFEVKRIDSGLENVALDLSDEETRKKRVTFNDEIQYNTDIVKKKKKKKKKNKLDKYEVVTSKLKKNSEPVEPVSFVNEALDTQVLNEEQIDNELNEIKSKKSRRKKVRRLSTLETIQEAPEEEEISVVETRERNLGDDVEIVCEFNQGDRQEIAKSNSKAKHRKEKRKIIPTGHASSCESEDKIIEEIDISEEVIANKKKLKKTRSNQNCPQNEEASSLFKNSEKENEWRTENTNKISNKGKGKKKNSSHEDVISLEEFLNEDRASEIKAEEKNSSKVSVPENIKNNTSDRTKFNSGTPRCTSQKHQKPKEIIKALFIKNPTLMFKGSNINDIPGYGSQISHGYH